MTKSKKMFRQLFLVILSVLMVFGNLSTAEAAVVNQDEITPYYTVIGYNSSSFEISGIKAKCSAYLAADYKTSLKIKIEMQKKKSGVYSTVETWNASKTDVTLSLSVSRNINLLYDYRAKITFTAGSETEVVYRYDQ